MSARSVRAASGRLIRNLLAGYPSPHPCPVAGNGPRVVASRRRRSRSAAGATAAGRPHPRAPRWSSSIFDSGSPARQSAPQQTTIASAESTLRDRQHRLIDQEFEFLRHEILSGPEGYRRPDPDTNACPLYGQRPHLVNRHRYDARIRRSTPPRRRRRGAHRDRHTAHARNRPSAKVLIANTGSLK